MCRVGEDGLADEILRHQARIGAPGQYAPLSRLARDLGLRVADLTAALEALMEEDAKNGKPLRAALCEGRLSAGLPAKGFFLKAASLGFDLSDPVGFVASQRAALALTAP